jgi:mono/diheme cytochrome c family protein
MYYGPILNVRVPSSQHRVAIVFTAAISCALATAGFAQDFDDEESPRKPGLVATYTADGGRSATRIDETLAFDWQTAPPDERLPAGGFAAVWRGRLWSQTPGIHRLHVYVQGEVSVKLGGKEIVAGSCKEPQWFSSEPRDLPFDYHLLEIAYRKLGEQAHVALYWSGPNFVLEPVPERFLFHDRTESPTPAFERGRQMAAALRCEACHRNADAAAASLAMPAPALDKLSGNISREWLVEWLSGKGDREEVVRRMPHFGMERDEAAAIAGWLLQLGKVEVEQKDAKNAKIGTDKSQKSEKLSKPSGEQGERLFLTLGCLACHQHGDLGESGLFGGGDLTSIAAKRPAGFFDRWLADPASLNKHHRMPVFALSADERASLSLWLARQSAVGNALRGIPEPEENSSNKTIAQGEQLVARFRCAACHSLPEQKPTAPALVKPLSDGSDWSQSCAGEPAVSKSRPGYRLAEDDRASLQAYFSAFRPESSKPAPQSAGRDLLVQLNCLACHQREGIDRATAFLPARLQDKLAAVAELHSELAKELPAMTPPALNSVGDKLHDAALAAAIRREGPPHRPYLLARMPKFNVTDEQLAALTAYFVATDRIPEDRRQGTGDRQSATARCACRCRPAPRYDRWLRLHELPPGWQRQSRQGAAECPRAQSFDAR